MRALSWGCMGAMPVLLMSGDPPREVDLGSGDAPRRFIKKPFKVAELLDALRSLLP